MDSGGKGERGGKDVKDEKADKKSESGSESGSESDEEADPYASLKRPADTVGDVRKLELLYFKPECVPDSFSAILYGQRRTGKTTWLTWFLYCMQGKVDHVVCFSSTNFTGHYGQYMNPDLCYDSFNEDVLQKVLDIQAATPAGQRKRVLVILDDVLDQEKELRQSTSLKALFTMGRHYGISVVVTTQYAKCIPVGWRRNVDFACVFYTFSRDMCDIYHKEYGMLLNKNQFFSIMQSACVGFRALLIRPCTRSSNIRDVYQLTEAMPHRAFHIGRRKKEEADDLGH
jgi:hypothetical protein